MTNQTKYIVGGAVAIAVVSYLVWRKRNKQSKDSSLNIEAECRRVTPQVAMVKTKNPKMNTSAYEDGVTKCVANKETDIRDANKPLPIGVPNKFESSGSMAGMGSSYWVGENNNYYRKSSFGVAGGVAIKTSRRQYIDSWNGWQKMKIELSNLAKAHSNAFEASKKL